MFLTILLNGYLIGIIVAFFLLTLLIFRTERPAMTDLENLKDY